MGVKQTWVVTWISHASLLPHHAQLSLLSAFLIRMELVSPHHCPGFRVGMPGGGCHSHWCFVCLGVCVCVFTTPMSLKVVSINCPKCPLLCLLIPSSKQTWKPLISLLFPLWFVMQDLFSCAVFICASLIQLGQPAGKLQESPVSVPPVLGIWMQVLELA